ncbi:tetratricopeptide repeat protein [Candidatus Bipolaricaulota bacterium]|nr:tetratricopeptide repeat protein [Candidatus Bipolaricaulota bacterium]
MAGHPSGEGQDLVPPLPDPNSLSAGDRERVVAQALARAEELRRGRRYKEGIDLLVDALSYGLDKAQVYFRLGNLYFDAGDLGRAEYAYQRAIQEDPKHAAAHHNLGVVYRRQKKISQSVKMLKKARSLELRYPRRVPLSPDQKRAVKRLALPMMLVPVAILAIILLVFWLVNRLT